MTPRGVRHLILYKCKMQNVNVIFILSRYINYKKHKLLRLLADWIIRVIQEDQNDDFSDTIKFEILAIQN